MKRALKGAFFIVALLVGCSREDRLSIITIHKAAGENLEIQVEVADTPELRARGLMFRKSLPEGKGMLFIFPGETQSSFWMRNTPIPLDLIFIRQGEVVDVIENAIPYDETLLTPDTTYTTTLEVPGGYVLRHNVRPGDRIHWKGPKS